MFYLDTKLALLVETNYKLLHLFSRFGIELGFGDKSVEEVCEEYGISKNAFLMICNIYSFDNYSPKIELLDATDALATVNYLRTSHIYYADTLLPKLKEKFDKLTSTTDASYKKALNRFFDDYLSEVDNHFQYEDQTAFPYIYSLLEGKKRTDKYSIELFEKNHSNIDDKLSDLKSIIIKYLPRSNSSTLRNDVLFDIFELEEDLDRHTLVEDKMLVPLIVKLENNER